MRCILHALGATTVARMLNEQPASGQLEYLADMLGDYHGLNMAVSPDGNSIYYSLGSSFCRYDIPGDATVPMGTLSEYLVSMDFGPDGLLYGIGEQWQLCTLDLDTLNATSVGPAYLGLKIDGLVRCLEFAPDGTLYASVDPTEYEPGDPPDEYVCTIDPATGLGTMHWNAQIHLGSDPFRTDTLAIPVPEPCTLVLLSLGAMGLVAYAWRKRRRW